MTAITTRRVAANPPAFSIVLRATAVVLTLATAWIHFSLGSTLFLLDAIGYTVLAVALVLPGLGPVRWLVRYALIGFTAMTIVGWVLFGARFDLAYLDKAIEVALIAVLLTESWIVEGGPVAVTRRALRMIGVAR